MKSYRAILVACLLGRFIISDLTATPPNIVHIMVDDAGLGDITSFWDDSPVATPNLDQLAADGMRFTRAYAGAANCAPSRSTLMTGLHAGHTYMRVNSGANSLRDVDVTIAEMLKSAGYATGGYGKWGLGVPGTPGAAERQGFDEFVGYYDQVHAHSHFPDRLYDSGVALLIPENANFNEPETGLVPNSRVHAHRIIFARMQQFIQAKIKTGTPFYTWGAWTPPHRKSTLNQSEADRGGFYAQYADREGWDDFDKIQAAFVSWIDAQVGELRAMLADPNGDGDESDSVAEETLILFTSDNGGWQSQHNWDRNIETRSGKTFDLRGAKERYYEGGLRTPMIAFWPGKIEPGSQTDIPVAFYDYMATFADLARIEPISPTDGHSFAATLTGEGQQASREGLYFEGYAYDPNSTPTQIGHLDEWKMIRKGNEIQLFDLENDPNEQTNLANDPAAAAAKNRLLAYLLKNRLPMVSQLAVSPPDVGTGNARRDGVVARGMRSAQDGRNWRIDRSGDARRFTGEVLSGEGQVTAYLDDFQMLYDVELQVTRQSDVAPMLSISLQGSSGFTYLRGSLETDSLPVGEAAVLQTSLSYVQDSPGQKKLAGDLGNGLTLVVTHPGEAGQVTISNLQLSGHGAELTAPVDLGDLDANGQIDLSDWKLFRERLFTPVKRMGAMDAVQCGDFNADGAIDEADFLNFRHLYDAAHGSGAFAAAVVRGEPEPGVTPAASEIGSRLLRAVEAGRR